MSKPSILVKIGIASKLAKKAPVGPTDAMPGSVEKLAVMIARKANGMRVFHDEDRVHYFAREEEESCPTR